jgi:predicted class III extradiol MEMO1 family dioxygenase
MSPLIAQFHPGCYPSDPAKALAFMKAALSAKLDMPLAPQGLQLAGIIAPHLGPFHLALPAYVAGFRPLLAEPLAENYLILGVGHRSRLEWNLDRRDYDTPLGRALCATDLLETIAGDTEPKRLFLPEAHEGEHSIEFPLIWLQALHRLHPSGGNVPVRFVPLLCGGLHHYVDGAAEWDDLAFFHRLAAALGKLFKQVPPGEKLRIIVSIDGCHIGPRFQHPFRVTPKLLKATAAWEEHLWAQAAPGGVRPFLDWLRAEGNDRYFDGVGALALLMAAGGAAGKPFTIQRTQYGQSFAERDASVVTYSSGRVLL